MVNLREQLMELAIEAKKTDPKTGSFTEYMVDHFIAHGVTIRPLVPGHQDENNIAEMAFHNGEKYMKERILKKLYDLKGKALGVVRKTLDDVIQMVERVK